MDDLCDMVHQHTKREYITDGSTNWLNLEVREKKYVKWVPISRGKGIPTNTIYVKN